MSDIDRLFAACTAISQNIQYLEGWQKDHTNSPDPHSLCLWAQRHGDIVVLGFANGSVLRILHAPDCCETVWLADLNGDLDDLVGHPVPIVEIRSQDMADDDPAKNDESGTWTFVTLRGIKSSVDMRWCGTSNGYYSEAPTQEHWRPDTPLSCSLHAVMALLKGTRP